METVYNKIAGQSLERLAALSDGVFAIAMTLLVLDLHVPAAAALHSDADLSQALLGLLPNVTAYVMSFMTLGIFWVGQQTQFNTFARSDRTLTWIYLAFLLSVTLMPFSTGLLSSFITHRIALMVYWFNIAVMGAVLFVALRYAAGAGLMRTEALAERRTAQERR
ncbi:MAG TPA: TMEM175 family protein, partial [Thermomicrobiales bacterium]|nr:TMEM175 family protein [Thermomicrobiales bacterium]